LKRIKVRVEWTENERTKNVTIYNLRQNPDRTPLSGSITGQVKSEGAALMGAWVYVVENPNWEDSTDVNGNYEIKVSTGDWNLRASKKGYFSKQASPNNPYTVTEGETVDIDNDADGCKLDLALLKKGKIWGCVIISTGGSTDGTIVPGAIITCNDETSDPVASKSTSAYSDTPPHNFELREVSTGTWTIFATTGTPLYISGSTTVVVEVIGAWVYYDILLTTSTTTGSISGMVYKDDSGDHKDIKVSGGGISYTQTSGSYTIENVAAGAVTVTANPNADNQSYTTETTSVTAAVGQNVRADDIIIYPAGKISGTIKTVGGAAYPRMVVRVKDVGGVERGVGMSDADGYYKLTQLPTQMEGTIRNPYTIMPVLDAGDVSVPGWVSDPAASTQVVKGETASGCDFTITRAWGYINGNVTDEGEPITTGVLILASTGTISDSDSPPDMNVGATGIYGGITRTEGEYEIKVRTDYTYNVYAWYTKINDSWDGTETTSIGPKVAAMPVGTISVQIDFDW